MQMVAKAANEEKTGVLNDKSERWVSERKKIWDSLGWGALYSKGEKVARSKEAAIIDSHVLDVGNLDKLEIFSDDVMRMIASDTELWNMIIDHSEKFLHKQSKIFGNGVKAEKREPDEVWINWFGAGEWKAKKGDEKSNTESKGQGSAASHERIAELRQWGKDVSKWAKMTANFARLLNELAQDRA
ncbi:hypothetical protein sscle_01g003040 [Sclerotinia sclerotiorum 1980 UF-70]|nr:hypothetical protein sscle_01g003040 [Sclerotinia sclerotiorum 1980 UF-70]